MLSINPPKRNEVSRDWYSRMFKEKVTMKFKFNYVQNRLWWKLNGEYSHEVSEENYFRTNFGFYGGNGFWLGDNHWIAFTLYSENRINAFYKQVANSGITSYFCKTIYLTPNIHLVELEFTEQDQVEKINDKWVRKRE